jgi:Uncharacterised nucleotidyltransferase
MTALAERPDSFAGHLIDEAIGIVEAAEARGLRVRLLGGIGVRLLLGAQFDPAFERPHRDIDAMVRRGDARKVEHLLEERGWAPATAFNALNGGRRLLFHDPLSEAQVDVFVENFEMCHKLPLADNLDQDGPALCATDLLMSKLQIVELNEKDRSDLYALLRGCPIGSGNPSSIDPARVAALTSRDWGLHHTFELNLARLLDGLRAEAAPAADVAPIGAAIDAITAAMHDAPKSRAWSMRARIGERKRWYDEPEEVDRG